MVYSIVHLTLDMADLKSIYLSENMQYCSASDDLADLVLNNGGLALLRYETSLADKDLVLQMLVSSITSLEIGGKGSVSCQTGTRNSIVAEERSNLPRRRNE